jgi:hypothetical protein
MTRAVIVSPFKRQFPASVVDALCHRLHRMRHDRDGPNGDSSGDGEGNDFEEQRLSRASRQAQPEPFGSMLWHRYPARLGTIDWGDEFHALFVILGIKNPRNILRTL